MLLSNRSGGILVEVQEHNCEILIGAIFRRFITMAWNGDFERCRDCGTEDPQLEYQSGRMPRCYDCQNHLNITSTAPYKRFDAAGRQQVSREELVDWKREQDRVCYYCGNTDFDRGIYSLNVHNNRNGVRHEALNVDRIDSREPYVLENLVLCCGLCNSIKSSNLTLEEMRELGPHLLEILQRNRV